MLPLFSLDLYLAVYGNAELYSTSIFRFQRTHDTVVCGTNFHTYQSLIALVIL